MENSGIDAVSFEPPSHLVPQSACQRNDSAILPPFGHCRSNATEVRWTFPEQFTTCPDWSWLARSIPDDGRKDEGVALLERAKGQLPSASQCGLKGGYWTSTSSMCPPNKL
jgi:hypothetical protein